MKAIVFALIAMFFYAIANVILETKLSRFNNLTIMVVYSAVIFTVAFAGRQLVYNPAGGFQFPTGWFLWFAVLAGLVWTAADYFYIGAFTGGGSLYTITIISVMFPVFASVMKFALTRDLPNGWQVAGYLAAVVAVLLVIRGNTLMGK